MSIVQVRPFDSATAVPWQYLASNGFWASLPRLAQGVACAKLLMIADTLRLEDIREGFQATAVPEDQQPFGVRAYRMLYDDFLRQVVSDVRYIRLYLSLQSSLADQALCSVLGSYGVQAQPLNHKLPLPFTQATDEWTHVKAADGRLYALLRSKTTQFGAIYPRSLHRLFTQEFPVWGAMNVYTYSSKEALQTLRYKSVAARVGDKKTQEQAQEAVDVESTVGRLRMEMNRTGGMLHTVRFYIMVGADDLPTLNSRLEVVRASLPVDMERIYPPGGEISKAFSAQPLPDSDGAVLTSPGVALLTGSAFSYRRRTETRGILLGVDVNQSPVIFDVFDRRNPSYNAVVLGQTGSGKTFAVQLIMLRQMALGNRLVIVDPQGNIDLSFLGDDVCHKATLGTGASAINVLDIHHDEIGMQIESVCSMLSLIGVLKRGDPVERAMLDDVLLDIYTPIWGKGAEAPTLQALQRRLEVLTGNARLPAVRGAAQMLSYMLGPYINGSYAQLFGRPTTVDFSLDHLVTVYDISRLPQQEMGGNLRSALLSILVADVNQAIRRRRMAGDTTPILMFVDEMGMLMRDGVIASHVSKEFMTARARRVGMIVADQDLHTLLGPRDASGLHHGAPILFNSAFNFIFYQKGSERELIRESFPDIPDNLQEALYSLPRGVCLAKLPDDLLLVNVRPSSFDEIVLSSQLHDRQSAQAIIRRMAKEYSG